MLRSQSPFWCQQVFAESQLAIVRRARRGDNVLYGRTYTFCMEPCNVLLYGRVMFRSVPVSVGWINRSTHVSPPGPSYTKQLCSALEGSIWMTHVIENLFLQVDSSGLVTSYESEGPLQFPLVLRVFPLMPVGRIPQRAFHWGSVQLEEVQGEGWWSVFQCYYFGSSSSQNLLRPPLLLMMSLHLTLFSVSAA